MPVAPSFCSGTDPPFRIRQVDGSSNIIGEEDEAGPFGDGDVMRHWTVILPFLISERIRYVLLRILRLGCNEWLRSWRRGRVPRAV